MQLSGVIISYNEEQNIERCILSMKQVCDEIVVLDSYSTDKTEAICRKHSVRFYQQAFRGYTEQKNDVVALANNDFVLSLDADEELSEELIMSILKIKADFRSDAYYFNRLNIYCGHKIRTTTWYPDRKIRIWNRCKAKWEGEQLHETVQADPTIKKSFLKGDLLHYSYKTIGDHVAQTNHFTDIASETLFLKGKTSSLFKVIYKTSFSAFKEFIIKRAIIGGRYSIIVAYINVFSVFLKYSKLISKQSQDKKSHEGK
jgi:glycosyltransferase involved in cell wall biosynthesis